MKASAALPANKQQAFYFLLTIVRVAIGWHFLYEGLSKLLTPGWTSASYLANARGPFADFYHWLAATPPVTQVADFLNIWGLIAIGLALFLGAFTRAAALGGALLLGLYYFAYLPIGNLDYGVPSEGSYLVVNKNLIELITLVLLAAAPAARLWGIDRLRALRRTEPGAQAATATGGGAGRRELLKNLSTLPLLGVFGWLTVNDRKQEVDGMSGATIKVSDSNLADLEGALPSGKLGDHTVSRLILGGNLIGGWAHARDLLYVSSLFKAYNTKEKVFETLMLAEKAGVNTMNVTVGMLGLIRQYKELYGGKIQTICQLYPERDDPELVVKQAIDGGADIMQLQGGAVDECVRDDRIDVIEATMAFAQRQGYVTGLAAHDVHALAACEAYGLQPDFLMKTMHHDNYWSAHPRENREPFQVVNYDYAEHHDGYHDNIFCLFPDKTNAYLQQSAVPVIGFKVLAGGAIEPADGFQYAFDNGADFICVGMFDYQIVDDVNIAIQAIEKAERKRAWKA